MSSPSTKCFENTNVKKNQSNDTLDSTRDVLEIWNRCLRGYSPGSAKELNFQITYFTLLLSNYSVQLGYVQLQS
jgi:hypothetical protein